MASRGCCLAVSPGRHRLRHSSLLEPAVNISIKTRRLPIAPSSQARSATQQRHTLLDNSLAHKLIESDLSRRGSGGIEGTVYPRLAPCRDVRNDRRDYGRRVFSRPRSTTPRCKSMIITGAARGSNSNTSGPASTVGIVTSLIPSLRFLRPSRMPIPPETEAIGLRLQVVHALALTR